MASTSAGAVKAFLESTVGQWKPSDYVPGIPIFRDRAPDSEAGAAQALPYITVSEGLGLIPKIRGGGARAIATELVQVDLWQSWKAKAPGTTRENPTLSNNLVRILDMAPLPAAPNRSFFMTVMNSVRIPMLDADEIHTAITLNIQRLL